MERNARLKWGRVELVVERRKLAVERDSDLYWGGIEVVLEWNNSLE
ncbi:hypothetical protein [Paenibacillus yanchengensis]|uniref:Uncharacterized protein n=1 Tax=Paenibacillus yanchengensis TaxID=2035833 RepID=A0ABW4YGN3_9BACL